MKEDGRRVFIETLVGAAAVGAAAAPAAAAPQAVPERELAEREQRLADALRALNGAAELGIPSEDLARAEAYATGALLEVARRLRPLVLDDRLEPPLDFDARGSGVTAGSEPAYLTAAQLVEGYRAGRISPVEVAEDQLARIERLDRGINSFITVTGERAREQARASQARYRRGAPASALDGVPYAAKDIFATRGIRTTHGSKLGRDHLPAETATSVERMEAAGAVLLGKLNLLEFATGSGTESGFGPTRNPWAPERDPGGSSSGSGAALAAGLATLALGTDTGGSIRNPASRCGVVGLKPSYGRVSRHGVTPLAWSLDHAGPMARSVRDVARCLAALAGHDPKDRSSARDPVPDYEGALESASLRGRRYALAPELLAQVDPEVRAVFEAALRQLDALGARRVDVALPSAGAANVCSEIIIGSEAAAFHEENLKRPERRALMDPAVRMYATCGRVYLAADYVKAQRLRSQLQSELEAALRQADVLLCPSEPTLTPKLGEAPKLQGRELMWFEYGTVNLGNLTGAPALSLPCGFSADGMPVGLQVYGRAFDETGVLGFGHAYERSTDWHLRRPPLGEAQ